MRSQAHTSTDVEAAAAGFLHHLVEPGPARPGTGDAVGVFGDDLEAALGSELAQVKQLCLGVLVDSRDTAISDRIG
jgi:hypothetical protein